VPHSPKALETVIVENASAEVINNLNSIELSPESMESPKNEKFIPDKDQMKESNEFSLNQCLVRVERQYWQIMLKKLKSNKQKDEVLVIRSFYRWSLLE